MLPEHLQERVRPDSPAPRSDGQYVIYWVRIAVRATENPALDVALAAAKALNKPVFVYHAISQRYHYASDRFHTFMLEGARDLQQHLKARGIGAVFHLETPADSGRHLESLARNAALVVTDFMPVQPFTKWDKAVQQIAPLWQVDASCVAPIWRLQEPIERAFEFRKAADLLWKKRLGRQWVDVESSGPAFIPDISFTSIDLKTADIPELVAGLEIDHSVAPLHHTVGGAVAANARWSHYRDHHLHRYASDRNDPLKEAHSRMSGYLHFGNISPFTMARECVAHRTESADKYLDELLTWRELAWHFCLHHPHHESIEVLPAWARETLKRHEHDPREAIYSYEQLARAQTHSPLWNAAQRSLLTHGELHNNVRMTWGKAVLGWSRTASDALEKLIDLNHRYALDGRDPASYGGILWCMGAFDRPFTPELPVIGTVRPRPTEEQAKRFDVAEYERRMHVPSRRRPLMVGIIGGGVAGTSAARALIDAGHAVTMFDKGRGPGGRLATRRDGEHRFDHGAPFLKVHDERFARFARSWWTEQVLTLWKVNPVTIGPGAEELHREKAGYPPVRLVAQPEMATLLSRMQHGIDVRFGVEVGEIKRDGSLWKVKNKNNEHLGDYDALIVATPGPQAAALIDASTFSMASRIREATYDPCIALMVSFSSNVSPDFEAASVHTGILRWFARDSSKPGRPPGNRWVIHAGPEFSRRYLDRPAEDAIAPMLEAFFSATGAKPEVPQFQAAHRWRYAFVDTSLNINCLYEKELSLVACGDWCLGPRVEHAWLSGMAAAGRLNAIPALEGDTEPRPFNRAATQMKLL